MVKFLPVFARVSVFVCVPQNTGQTKLSDTFVGKVVEVVSGDTVVVKDINAGGVERRISLSR